MIIQLRVYNRILLAVGVKLPLWADLVFAPDDEMIHEEKTAKTRKGARVISHRAAPGLPVIG